MALRVGVIGCGAAATMGHLPALALDDRFSPAVLVDVNLERAKALALQYRVPVHKADYRDAIGLIDAAIVALPHALHASTTIELLRAGIHVLVEKPMALSTAECDAMVIAAESSGARLAVGLVRRYYPATRLLKNLLSSGALSDLESFDVQEGHVFRSPVASDTLFRRETAGGGVLMDTGVHILDIVAHCLQDIDVTSYSDDAFGGVEANCVIELVSARGARGRVELSRMRQLRNTFRMQFSTGLLEIGVEAEARVTYTPSGGDAKFEGVVSDASYPELMRRQLADLAAAIETGSAPSVPAEEGRKSVALIEACYRTRTPIDLPWLHTDAFQCFLLEPE